ncbi:bacteriochlorophyll 4-vinyl reductase [Parasphingopyxis sp.]|uniref:bacteriochlorophyll 4-vinyl reductase n=1 Tax=Parasphingopyxis sp. TaxID=1920299 RepID=UPI002638B296|nr:bacteriochlorophyll 4-vinyl reductase [Parasphingopyxis sp.]
MSRLPADARLDAPGLIGPNAILQLLPVVEQAYGAGRAGAMLKRARIAAVPDGEHMIPEGDAARLHRLLRVQDPERAPGLAAEAGRRTADYILAHRIPKFPQMVLKLLPAPLAARGLSRAIARHAWTFAGSGSFRVVDPWTFEIAHNPMISGEHSNLPICHWHAAVFERLYQALVCRRSMCVETQCGAQDDSDICRFEIFRNAG